MRTIRQRQHGPLGAGGHHPANGDADRAESGSYLSGCTLTLTATASAMTGSIGCVNFYQGSTLLATGVPMNGVYTCVWSDVPAGNYSLTAKAYDSHAAWTVSNAVNITVTAVPCATPAFTPAAGTFTTSPSVTITTGTNGATIRYTTDGTTPSETAGTVYSSPVSITASGTLQAIAYAPGMSDSQIHSGSYTIHSVAPVAANDAYTLNENTHPHHQRPRRAGE